MQFKVGETYQTYQVPSGFYKIHILAIVDECHVVYKWYDRHRQWWHYEVDHVHDLTWKIEFAEGQKDKLRETP